MGNAHDAPDAFLSLGTVPEPASLDAHSRHVIQTVTRDRGRANANDAKDARAPQLG